MALAGGAGAWWPNSRLWLYCKALANPEGARLIPIAQQRAARVYLLITSSTGFAFSLMFTVNLLYQAQVIGLNPLQLVLVGTVLEIVAFSFEIPTGIVADVVSRRLSVIIGCALIGVGFLIEGLAATLAAVLLNQVIWGLGITFISGALDAWVADEVGETALPGVLLRGAQAGSLACIAGTIAAGLLGSIALNLPIVIGGSLFIALAAALLLLMPETGFTPPPRSERQGVISAFLAVWATARAGFVQIRANRYAGLCGLAGAGGAAAAGSPPAG